MYVLMCMGCNGGAAHNLNRGRRCACTHAHTRVCVHTQPTGTCIYTRVTTQHRKSKCTALPSTFPGMGGPCSPPAPSGPGAGAEGLEPSLAPVGGRGVSQAHGCILGPTWPHPAQHWVFPPPSTPCWHLALPQFPHCRRVGKLRHAQDFQWRERMNKTPSSPVTLPEAPKFPDTPSTLGAPDRQARRAHPANGATVELSSPVTGATGMEWACGGVGAEEERLVTAEFQLIRGFGACVLVLGLITHRELNH